MWSLWISVLQSSLDGILVSFRLSLLFPKLFSDVIRYVESALFISIPSAFPHFRVFRRHSRHFVFGSPQDYQTRASQAGRSAWLLPIPGPFTGSLVLATTIPAESPRSLSTTTATNTFAAATGNFRKFHHHKYIFINSLILQILPAHCFLAFSMHLNWSIAKIYLTILTRNLL